MKVTIELTPAQARTVNAALGLYESEANTDGVVAEDFQADVLARTRRKVWDAMQTAGVEL